MTSKIRTSIQHLNLQSAEQSIPHSDKLPVPAFKTLQISDSKNDFIPTENTKDIHKESDAPARFGGISQLFTKADLNDLVRDLDLTKISAELLALRLNDKSSLARRTVVNFNRNRERDLVQLLERWTNLCFAMISTVF